MALPLVTTIGQLARYGAYWFVFQLTCGIAAAQGVQGPPDGFRPPVDARAPAQGPPDDGIPPLPPPPLQQPLPQPETRPPRELAPSTGGGAPAVADGRVRPERTSIPTARPVSPGERPPGQGPIAPNPSASGPLSVPAASPIPSPVAGPFASDGQAQAAPDANVAAEATVHGGWSSNWLAAGALLLLLAAAGLWWRLQQSRVVAASLVPVDRATPSDEEFAKPDPPQPQAEPRAFPQPKPAKVPSTTPTIKTSAAVPELVPDVAATGRAKLTMTLQMQSIELTVDSARFGFTLLLANSGDRAATGGLVRIALQQAHANQAKLLESFFGGAGGSLLAENIEIASGDVATIQRNASLPLDAAEALLVGGYPSLIPVIGLDVTYHWDGEPAGGTDESFGQVAAAFVIGTGSAADGRIAPVRLDLGPRRLSPPASRVTEMQRVL